MSDWFNDIIRAHDYSSIESLLLIYWLEKLNTTFKTAVIDVNQRRVKSDLLTTDGIL